MERCLMALPLLPLSPFVYDALRQQSATQMQHRAQQQAAQMQRLSGVYNDAYNNELAQQQAGNQMAMMQNAAQSQLQSAYSDGMISALYGYKVYNPWGAAPILTGEKHAKSDGNSASSKPS